MSFKTHVQKKIVLTTKTLHLLHRLMNSEWDLLTSAEKQLYSACITFINDYDSSIWWKQQKNFEKLFQKLQNSATRKILEVFRFLLSAAMKLKLIILSLKIKLDKTSELYALKVINLSENHSIKQRTSYTFSSEFRTDIDIDENQYLNWNQYFNTSVKKNIQHSLLKCFIVFVNIF